MRQQHRQLRTGQPASITCAAFQILGIAKPFVSPVHAAQVFQRLDQARLRTHGPAAALFGDGQRQRLQAVVFQHQLGDFLGHVLQQRVAPFFGQAPGLPRTGQRDLDVHLVVGTVDTGGIVDEVGVHAPARQCELDAPGLRHAKVGAFADHLGAQILAVHPQPVVGGIAHFGVGLVGRLHIGADPAEPDQVAGAPENGGNQAVGIDPAFRHVAFGKAQRVHRGLGQVDALHRAREYPAAARYQLLVVFRPVRPLHLEQALALLPAGSRIGIRVDEDMAMVERRDQQDRFRQQHAVAEHVSRHVAAAHHAHRVFLHVHAHFQEVALHRNPGAAGGNAHGLVVVAVGTAAGEGIAQPEVALHRDGVRGVGERGRALVGRDHEVGIVTVVDHHAFGMHDLVAFVIVRDRKQGADIQLVAFLALGEPCLTVNGGIGQALGIEAALCARGHDDRVLHLLRLHQAKHFGAEIVAPVRPADTATRHGAGTQVHAFHAARIDEDLAPRHGLRQAWHGRGIELEGQCLAGRGGKGVGAQHGTDGGPVQAQDAIVVDRAHFAKAGADLVVQRLRRLVPVAGGAGIVQGAEQVDQAARHLGCAGKGIHHGVDGEGDVGLAQVAIEGAQPVRLGRDEAGIDDEAVEHVVFGALVQHARDRVLDIVRPAQQVVMADARRKAQREIVDRPGVLALQLRGNLRQDAETEVLQRRHGVGQGQRAVMLVDLQAQQTVLVRIRMIQPHVAGLLAFVDFRRQQAQARDVGRGLGCGIGVAIEVRETLGVAQGEGGSAAGVLGFGQCVFHRVLPAAQHVAQRLVHRCGIDGAALAAKVHDIAQQGQVSAFHHQTPVQGAGTGLRLQHVLNLQAHGGGEHVARKPDEGEYVTPQRSGDEGGTRAWTVCQAHHRGGDAGDVVIGKADDHVVRQRGERMDQRLVVMAAGREIQPVHDGFQLLPQDRHGIGLGNQRGAGPDAGMHAQRFHTALFHQRHDEQVQRHAPVHVRKTVGLHDQRCAALMAAGILQFAIEPGEGLVESVIRQQIRRGPAADAMRFGLLAVARAGDVAQQGQHAIAQPAQQRRAFGICQAIGVRAHGLAHLRPVGHRCPHVQDGGA